MALCLSPHSPFSVKKATAAQGKLVITVRKFLEARYRAGPPPPQPLTNVDIITPAPSPPSVVRAPSMAQSSSSRRRPRVSSQGAATASAATMSAAQHIPASGVAPGRMGPELGGGGSVDGAGPRASPLALPRQLAERPQGVSVVTALGLLGLLAAAVLGARRLPGVDVVGAAAIVAAAVVVVVRCVSLPPVRGGRGGRARARGRTEGGGQLGLRVGVSLLRRLSVRVRVGVSVGGRRVAPGTVVRGHQCI